MGTRPPCEGISRLADFLMQDDVWQHRQKKQALWNELTDCSTRNDMVSNLQGLPPSPDGCTSRYHKDGTFDKTMVPLA